MSDTAASPLIIAIDGPAASGKSTVAKKIAKNFGLTFVNSGAMYRAFTLHVLENGIDPATDVESVLKCLREVTFNCGERDGVSTIGVNGVEIPNALLSAPEVNSNVSAIAKIPEVRERLVAEQRNYGKKMPGLVMEGRDIGSVVFHETPYKFYVDASPEVRAQRRKAQGIDDEILERDKQDSSRKAAPLTIAEGAVVVDSSEMTADEVAEEIIKHIPATAAMSVPIVAKKRDMNPVYWLGYTFFKFLTWFYGDYKVIHREKLCEDAEGLLIASNHVSFVDPPVVGIAYHDAIYYFARKTLFDHPIANWIFTRWRAIPVNQDKPEISSLKKVIALLKDGKKVVLFPEGERSWDGVIKEKAEAGIGMIVSKSRKPVLPVRIFGAEKVLARGKKWPVKGKIRLVVGDPMDFTEFLDSGELKGKALYEEISLRIMREIAKLELPAEEA
ncbi:UNVERIFIED_CONTAM: hypothetical protein GTU68_016869 [Idotea baltica]|nr:hypothetical protein [Idotea baltica]